MCRDGADKVSRFLSVTSQKFGCEQFAGNTPRAQRTLTPRATHNKSKAQHNSRERNTITPMPKHDEETTAQRAAQAALQRAYRDDVRKALEVLARGGVILYPTDTIWGIGCDATNSEAVRRVFAIKQRADSKALISLVDSDAKVQFYFREVPEVAWQLIDCADRPLTLVLPEARNLAPELMAADGSAALRITHEPFSQMLCARFRRAIVSTSANISGQPAPHSFAEISPALHSAVDYVCLSRRDERHNPPASSVIKLGAGGEVQIIRP